jgi:hypothetical protein
VLRAIIHEYLHPDRNMPKTAFLEGRGLAITNDRVEKRL